MDETALPLAVEEVDLGGLGEALAEVVGGAGLKRLAVLHHRLDREGHHSTGEALFLWLLAGQHRHRQKGLGEVAVDLEHLLGIGARFGLRREGGVPLLPEELGRPQQHPRPHLPANHVRPLVHHQRQVAVGVDPFGKRAADDRLRGRPHDQRLGQLAAGPQMTGVLGVFFQPVMRDHRHLLGKALDVFGLALDVAERDEEREVGITGAAALDLPIELGLHQLPDRIAPGPDHHRPAHMSQFGHLPLPDHGLEPGGKVLLPGGRHAFVL